MRICIVVTFPFALLACLIIKIVEAVVWTIEDGAQLWNQTK